MERESAERRFSASSKELLVRVDGSRKRLTIVRPRSAGTFLMARLLTSENERAVSRIWVMSSAVRLVVSIRCLTDSMCWAPPVLYSVGLVQISTALVSS